jgi:hypothetical protein
VTHWTQKPGVTVVLHLGARAELHCVLLVQAATHTGGYSDVLHAVVVPVQADVSSCVQATQVLVVVSHAGRAPVVHCVLLVQATQVLVVVLQAGVVPVQAVESLAVHWTQVLVAALHAGRTPVQAASLVAVHWTQVLVAVSQTAVPPVQFAVLPLVHWTQVLVVVSQTVRRPVCVEHSPLVMHWTQVPALQKGVGSAHWPSPVQPVVTQVFVVRLHVPPSPQLVLLVQATQVFVAVLQYGVAPLQLPSPVQATQVLVVVLHAGVAPVQAAVESVAHWTQVFVVRLQTGVAPEQLAWPTHCTHWPIVGLQ